MSSAIEALREATKKYERRVKFQDEFYPQLLKKYSGLDDHSRIDKIVAPGEIYLGERTDGLLIISIIISYEDLPDVHIPKLPHLDAFDQFNLDAIYYKSEVMKSNELIREIEKFKVPSGTSLEFPEDGMDLVLTYHFFA